MKNVIVIKVGGSTLGSHDTAIEDIVELQKRGRSLVVVHGGGKLITEWLAKQDIPSRFGDDEFIIVLNESTSEGAYQRAREIRNGINNLEFHYMDKILGNIEVSIGVACYPEHGDNVGTLLKRSEHALNKAKNSGGNQVFLSEIKIP